MTNTVASAGPLAGIRIMDMSRILAGPSCTQLLGDLGADVIKVERPGVGDDTRGWGPPFLQGPDGETNGQSAYYLSANRNKRSIAVDMTSDGGRETLHRLAATSDVVIENFKTGGLRKYGLDAATMCAKFPRLIYCSITGFGQTGPNASRPGYDLLAQACGGIMALTGAPDGEPMKVGVGIADVMCGMYASNAILAALLHRNKTGEGQQIDIGLADTQVAWLVNSGQNYLTSGQAPKRYGNAHPNIVPYQVFATADGHAVVAAGNDNQFARFCGLLGRDELASDPRFVTNAARLDNRDALIAVLTAEIATWAKDDLVNGMERCGVPGGPINTVPEVFASEQVAARGMKITMPTESSDSGHVDLIGNPIKFSKTPVTYRRAPPTCGQDTEEVLSELQSAPDIAN